MSGVTSRLKAHFFQPSLFERLLPGPWLWVALVVALLFVSWSSWQLFADLVRIGEILQLAKQLEVPLSWARYASILDIALSSIYVIVVALGLSLICAAELVARRARIVLAGILRIPAYLLLGIGIMLYLINLIEGISALVKLLG